MEKLIIIQKIMMDFSDRTGGVGTGWSIFSLSDEVDACSEPCCGGNRRFQI